jgi:hypothetical protein
MPNRFRGDLRGDGAESSWLSALLAFEPLGVLGDFEALGDFVFILCSPLVVRSNCIGRGDNRGTLGLGLSFLATTSISSAPLLTDSFRVVGPLISW